MEKKHLRILALVFLFALSLVGCNKYASVNAQLKDLYVVTDRFIRTLGYTYDPYYSNRGTVTSEDGCFSISRTNGRILIKKYSSKTELSYNEIADALSARYAKEPNVNRCFVNAVGTVTIELVIRDIRDWYF